MSEPSNRPKAKKHLPVTSPGSGADSRAEHPVRSGTPDEYQIDAQHFTQTLRDQRQTRQKGGLYHLTQVLMTYNTNRIEGSQLDQEQTRYIYETRTVAGDNIRVDDVVETLNSFELFDTMLDRLDAPITAQTMKDYHRILKQGTADAQRSTFVVGGWKRQANIVGGVDTTPPEHVELAIQDLLDRTAGSGQMSFDDIVDFHHGFESIHPFQDGNGRVGRVLMFQQCLQNDIMPFIVLDSKKMFYYRGLSEYEQQPGYLRDTFRSLQDDYYARFAKFVEVPELGDFPRMQVADPEAYASKLAPPETRMQRLTREVNQNAAGLETRTRDDAQKGIS